MHLGTDIRAAETIDASGVRSDAARTQTSRDTGLVAGTVLFTMDGELPVEHLAPGDRIVTRDSGVAVLRDIRVTQTLVAPVRIKAGSLGHQRPDGDTLVAPWAQVHIRDWRAEALYGVPKASVEAHRLIDGEFVTELPARQMRVYTLVFDRAHIVYANGLEVEVA